MSKGIFGELRRLVFSAVVLKEFSGGNADRFPPLFAGFFFKDLAVALLQPLPLMALLRYGQLLISSAGGTAVPPPVQSELVMIELAVLENAHPANSCPDTIQVLCAATVKSKLCGGGPFRAWSD